MNISKMKKLRAWILEEPRRYRQELWFMMIFGGVPVAERPPCGTAACLAGSACLMEGATIVDSSQVRMKDGRETFVSIEAKKILGLDEGVAKNLFLGDCGGWRLENALAYREAKTPLDRAKAAVAELDYLIARETKLRAARRKANR